MIELIAGICVIFLVFVGTAIGITVDRDFGGILVFLGLFILGGWAFANAFK
jgi:hypothetical protein